MLSRDRLDEALDAYRIAEEQRPDDCKPSYGAGRTLYHLARFEEAEVAYYRALELCPSYDKALTDLAGMRLDQGRYEVALRLSDSAIDVRASNVDAWVNRARALQHLGKGEEARDSIEKALAIDPSHQSAQQIRAELMRPRSE